MPAAETAAQAATPAPRVRPGDRPRWWDASADCVHFDAWRAQAAAQRIPVDRLIAALLELELVLGDLADATLDPVGVLQRALSGTQDIRAIGTAPSARRREGAGARAGIDELPELALPERIAGRLMPGTLLSRQVRLEQARLAIDCDRAATAEGLTLEVWALRAALRSLRVVSGAAGVDQPSHQAREQRTRGH